jgi:hypothetical protein
MTIQAGKTLRRLIATDQLLEEVMHFGVKQVFGPGTANYTCILVLDRRSRGSVRFEQVGQLEEWRYGQTGTVSIIPSGELTEEAWQFADADTRVLFERVRAAFPGRLGQGDTKLAEIFVGVQTSADPIFIFRPVGETASTVTLQWDGRDWPIERGILRPCLHDVTLFAYAGPRSNARMIFPYELVKGRTRTEARLIQPADMARRFPGCWAYLHARRNELDHRNVTGGTAADRQWYQFGRSQSLIKFDSPKIILPILSKEPRYAYDDTNTMVTGGGNGPYYMVRSLKGSTVTNHYLLAVLNHPLSEAFVRTNTSPFRGGYYSHGKQFIENLPIPVPAEPERTAIEILVTTLIDTLGASEAARTPHERTVKEREAADLKAQIEARISALFNLSDADMETVRAVPIPS